MFLEKIEIKGFKSFANKTVLTFPEAGKSGRQSITAIVGPNGAGKSNVADAIRWCLGEQSMRLLRAKSNEDIIFSGSSTKGKLGMAEVSLFLNNEDKRAPIDYTELTITRRFYRSGESEYRINDSKTRLNDILILLAKANFGQKTYSVIGQGMVDNFLGKNPSERKDFFDEATGVKQFQIKRDEAVRKLVHTHENLSQAGMLMAEIEPHLKSLTRQVNKLRRKNEIEQELRELRSKYYKHIWHELNDQFKEASSQLLGLEEEYRKKTTALEDVNKELSEMEKDSIKNDEYVRLNQHLSELYVDREEIIKKMSSIQTQLSMKFESTGNFDLSWLFNRENELKKEIEEDKNTIAGLENDLVSKRARSQDFEDEKNHINNQISNLNQKLFGLGEEARAGSSEEKSLKIKNKLKRLQGLLLEVESLEDLNQIKENLKEARNVLEEIVVLSEEEKDNDSFYVKQREIQDSLSSLTKEREALIERVSDHNLEMNSLAGKLILSKESLNKKEGEVKEIQEKINTNRGENPDNKDLEKKKEHLEKELGEIDRRISEAKLKINELKNQEEENRARIFKLQRSGQNLQNEINNINNQISLVKIDSAKHETKLENVEADIREVLDNLRQIQEERPEENINPEKTEHQIRKLANQYNMIGGIDPEIEKEYEETKNKYDFLYKQSSDLEETIETLDDIVKELDSKIKEKFTTEFKTICNKFEEYFKVLFGGGHAKIIKMTDQEVKKENEQEIKEMAGEEDVLDQFETPEADKLKEKIKKLSKSNATGLSGIDIQANPPGKAIKSINVLSGGEKAMTAIALICAIISVNPSPFIILDEIDAALDESNAEKLSKIIVDLSKKTQFILITHNRAPMHKADFLYGVTMQNDGISQLLSMKLEDYLKT